MTDINTKGMEVATLNEVQLSQLLEAEKKLNQGKQGHEIYLLATQRRP